MYKIIFEGKFISRIEIRTSVDGVTPAVYFSTNGEDSLLFEYIEQCYALITFLSLGGLEALSFDIKYKELGD